MTFTPRAGGIYEYEGEATPGRLLAGTFGTARGVGGPNGIRTRVSALRGPCPRPLDDGAARLPFKWLGVEGSNPHYQGQNLASYH